MTVLAVIGWIVAVIVFVLLVAIVVVWLDGTITRSDLERKLEIKKFEGRNRDVLICAVPGILNDETSIDPFKDTLLQYGDVWSYGYGRERFDAHQVCYDIASSLIAGRIDRYKHVVFVGTSMGGIVAQDALRMLPASCRPASVGGIFVDCISGAKNMGAGGNIGAPIMRLLPFGKLFNKIGQPIMKAMLVPPKDDEIQGNLDKAEVKRQVLQGMSGFKLSMWRDQLAYIAAHGKVTPSMFEGFDWAVYLRCDLNNVTVKQPHEANDWSRAMRQAGLEGAVEGVASPHAAYAQLPELWNKQFASILESKLSTRT